MVDGKASKPSLLASRTAARLPSLKSSVGVDITDYFPAGTSMRLLSVQYVTLTTTEITSAARGARLGCACTAGRTLLNVVWRR